MTVLIDQQKLVEAEDLWNTSIETFATKLGEDLANVLETRFQQCSLPPIKVQDIPTITPDEKISQYRDSIMLKLKRTERGWNGVSDELRDSVQVQYEAENYRMKLKENPASTSLFPPAESVDGSKASEVLHSAVSSPNSEIFAKYQHEHDCSPPPAAKQAGNHSSERTTKGKYSLANFEVLRTLGTGSFARVHLIQSKYDSGFFAIEVWKKEQIINMKQVEHICDERRMLSKIKHPFLMTLWGTFQDSKNLYMITDFIEGGEMFSLLRKSQRFPDPVAKFHAAEVILAIEYLYGENIIYRDIKPENILLDRHGHLKLCDFSFAKEIEDITWTLCGTPDYLAPEVLSSKGYNRSVDWWALGILIYEMLCGYTPFWDGGSAARIYENILKCRVKYPPYIHPDAKDLLQRLITADLTKRLGNTHGGAQAIKCHPWFAEVTWERLAKKDIDPPYRPPVRAGVGDASQYEKYPEETETYGDYGHDEWQINWFADTDTFSRGFDGALTNY
ncbi:related to cAMP-dependent protein kinase type 2 [Phialocephala subalpina]|uniref:cAMP-dependent protein kinase n=1 Tax=Phialocephala subalpina TaxID=576137 RepID=A0A1L7WP05_9HELO|nr:related to cAMP-dependent protein kinase type 2 [Phialocephala subalpina]